MADGDNWVLDRTTAIYETDTGKQYSHRALTRHQGQAALGWIAMTNEDITSAPKGLKKRVWLLWDAGDHSKRARVVVATNTAYVAGVIGTTTLAVCNPGTNVEDTFTLYGMEGERMRGRG